MSVVGLDLMPGYTAEPDGQGVRVMDAGGRPVARIAGDLSTRAAIEAEGAAEEESTEQANSRQDLCDALLLLVRSHAVECEFLRERLEHTEKALNKSERIAEELYQFFRDTAERSVNSKDTHPPADPYRD